MARKLLVATIGFCTVNYVACSSSQDHPPGNLMLPPDQPSTEPTATAATSGEPSSTPVDEHPPGNLAPPPPPPPKTSK